MKTQIRIIYGLAMLSLLCIGCNADDEENVPGVEENAVVDVKGEGVLVEGEKTYTLDWGYLEDWGLDYPGSRTYAIDLFSPDYREGEFKGVKVGIYFNSPSLTSFQTGTYIFKDPEHAPGGILAASISTNRTAAWLTEGYVKVEKEGSIYTITFEVTGEDREAEETRSFTGTYKGPLPLE